MPPKLKESDYFLSWIVQVLCYVVTYAMVGFAFNLIGMSLGWNVRNQMPLLKLIEIPVQLVTSYGCFRFLAKELVEKAVDRVLKEKQTQKPRSAGLPVPSVSKPEEGIGSAPASSDAV